MVKRRFRLVLVLLLALAALPMRGAQAQRRTSDPAFQALRRGDLYVAPSLQGQVNLGTLRQAASSQVKIALEAAVPPGPWRSRDDYAGKMHHALGLGSRALVLIVPPGGRGAGISISSQELGASEGTQLAQQYKTQIEGNLTTGTAALAQAVAAQLGATDSANPAAANSVGNTGQPNGGHGGAILGLIFLVIVGVVIFLIVSASRRRRLDLSAARGPVEALRANVLSGIEYIDHYTDVLPRNNPDADVVRTARQSAETKYEQAGQLLASASSEADLARAQGLLDRAQADIQQARGALDRALGGTANIPGDDAFRPPPMPQSQQQVNAIPTDQRAVSFFSGQPAPLGALVPVTMTVGGQPRQVYATPAEAAQLNQGQMPQVRAFNVGGQYVPWYAYNAYDPYRDYWQYQNNGWGGFGGGALAGFVGAELLNDLTMPSYGYGYSPYAFSPDFAYTQGYDAGLMNGQMDNQFYDGNNGGFDPGASFGADPTGGTDFTDYGNNTDPTGGVDFGGGTDFSDSSGGTDFGGGDFGGSDFGGGDTGGSGF